MCMAHETACACGAKRASLHMKNSVLPHEVVSRIYCPSCSQGVQVDPATMIVDNGWIIDFDMDVARLMSPQMQMAPAEVTPERLFDEGWCTWNGMEPEDFVRSPRERSELIRLAKSDPVAYVSAMRDWSIARMERLRREGWRKAMEPAAT